MTLLLLSSVASFAEAFGFRSKNSLPGFAFVEQYLDELGKFKIGIYRRTVSSYGDSHVNHTIQLMRYAGSGSGGEKNPEVILKGFKITANDREVLLNWNMRMVEGVATVNISDKNIDQVRDFRIQFYGKELGRYRFDPVAETLTELEPPKAISRFTFRDLAQRGGEAIEQFKTSGALVDLRSSTASVTDLHTHLTGALRLDEVIRLSIKYNIAMPVEILNREKVLYNPSKVFESNGGKYISFNDILAGLRHLSGYEIGQNFERLKQAFDIDPMVTIPFVRMSEIYRARSPLAKTPEAFPDILESLARDYQEQGVRYSELSFYQIIKPEFYEQLPELLLKLEHQYGVKLRFLVGMWRHSDENINASVIAESQAAMKKSPYIVGFDFMGHETNSTRDFAKALHMLSDLKKDFPRLVVRVHAGENPEHPENIIDAIKLGATRIGHGIYGVTSEVLDLAKEKNVIIEFNMTSNLSLKNINSTHDLPLRRYLDAGVRVTLGTDGHGLYSTSPQSEEAVARSLGISDQDMKFIRASDLNYIDEMEKDFIFRSSSSILSCSASLR